MEKNPLKIMSEVRWFFPLVLCLLAFLRISGLYQPILDIDESVFAEYANKLLTGSLPYSEVFDNKPPGIYYLFAAVFSFSGLSNIYAVHAVTTVIVFLTSIVIYYISRRMHGTTAAVLSVLFYIFMTHTYEPKYISTSGEILINFPLVLSALCYIKGRSKPGGSFLWIAAAGILLGGAVLINYKAGLCALLFIIDTIIIRWFMHERSWKVFLRESSVLAVVGFSSIVPIAAAAFYFYKIGVLNDFINWGFLYNFKYIDSGASSTPLWKILLRTSYFFISSIPVWLIIGAYLSRRFKIKPVLNKADSFVLFVWVWLAVSVWAALLGGRTYGHYFIQIAPPASLLAGNAASYLIEKRIHMLLLKTSAVVSVFITMLLFVSRIDIDATYKFINYNNWDVQPVFRSAGDYVRKNTSVTDTIYVWGWGTPVYIYSGRRCSSKVLLANYVSGKSFGSSTDYRVTVDSEFLSMMRAAFMKEFAAAPPELFLDTEKTGFFGYDHFPVKVFPELYDFVKKNYYKETEINGIAVYRLNR